MPLLTAGESGTCGSQRCGDCPGCEAEYALTADDVYCLGFYRRVSDQIINHAPMGTDSGEPWQTLRLEGLEAALRLYGYPREDWVRLVETARLLHKLKLHPLPGSEVRAVTLENCSG